MFNLSYLDFLNKQVSTIIKPWLWTILFFTWRFLFDLHSAKLREDFNNILEVLLDKKIINLKSDWLYISNILFIYFYYQ